MNFFIVISVNILVNVIQPSDSFSIIDTITTRNTYWTTSLLQSSRSNNNNINNNSSNNNNKASTSFNDAFLNSLENTGNNNPNDHNTITSGTIGTNIGKNNKNETNIKSIDNNATTMDNNNNYNDDLLVVDPPPDSLAALRDLATMNVANFLATFSHPPSIEDGVDDDNHEGNKEQLYMDYRNSQNYNYVTSSQPSIRPTGTSCSNANTSYAAGTNTSNVITNTITSKDQQGTKIQSKTIHWDVYICQSKQCIDRGASATLDSFQALVPSMPISFDDSSNDATINTKSSSPTTATTTKTSSTTTITIHPAILSKSKSKGPNIRVIQRTPPYKAFEVNNVNDIDKVYHILTKYMNISNISKQTKDCLKYTYQGNLNLQKNELSEAIQSYNMALEELYRVDNDANAVNTKTTNQEKDIDQEGMILLLRATAYLKRAFQHQEVLRQTVSDLGMTVSDPLQLGKLYSIAEEHPSLANTIFHKVILDAKAQDKKFRLTKYRHGLYEYSLLHAAQDSLKSTQLLPHHAKTWLRAGDALAELRKLKESALYYEKAMELDPTLRSRLEPVIDRLIRSQEFLDKARGWWSSDTLRLALDVAN